MNKKLKEASDEYELISKMGIFPMSVPDTKIVDKLTKILVGMEASDDLLKVIKQWKQTADQDILSLLEEIEVGEEQSGDGAMKKTIDFIQVGGYTLELKTIFSFSIIDGYDVKSSEPIFSILVNGTESNNTINGNIEIKFVDIDERDREMNDLNKRLEGLTHIRFL